MEQQQTQESSPSSGSVGDAPRPSADRFEWLDAAAYNGGWQYGEQGVLEEIFKVVGTTNTYCVEFGAGDGSGLPLTCGRFVDEGWDAILIESDAACCGHLKERYGPVVKILNQKVGVGPEDGLDAILEKEGAPKTPDLVVIDVDSTDYYIWKALEKHRPRVVCIEHHDLEHPAEMSDAAEPPPIEECGKVVDVNNGYGFAMQASARAIVALGESKGYTRVFTTRVNTIFIVADEAEKLARPMVKLNVGAGGKNIPGYTSIDIKDGIDARKLPYADCSVDEVYASHLLEHFDYNEEVPAVLKEWVRVLRPGGMLRISVPDVEKFCKERNETNSFIWDRIFLGGHTDANDRHGSVFDQKKLKQIMGMAGVGHVNHFKAFAADCSALPVSLNMEGRKRHFKKLANPRVGLVLSQPRVAFTGHERCMVKLAKKLKFDEEFSKGAYWERDTEIAIESVLVKYKSDIVLVSDYDSIFTEEDVRRILAVINNDPTIAAIGVIQMARHEDKPLVFDNQADYSGSLSDVRFQHFGLTAIRAEVFSELPHPWFWSMPGTDGRWTTFNRSDGDITFWRMLREYGFRTVQHNDVCIGHLITAIKWSRKDGSGVIIQPEDAYHVYGKPSNVGFNPALYMPKEEKKKEPPSPSA